MVRAEGQARGIVITGIIATISKKSEIMNPDIMSRIIIISVGIPDSPTKSKKLSAKLTSRVKTTVAMQVLKIQLNKFRTQPAKPVSIPNSERKDSLYVCAHEK